MKVFSLLFIFLFSGFPILAQKTQKPIFQKRPSALQKKVVTETIRVLALRVQFQKEIPDKSITTGHGHFDLSDQRATIKIDPAPHNKAFFEDQMLAMKNYFLDVSDGKLNIDYTVKPDGDTSAYTLSKLMEYYGIRGTQEARDKRLAEFFSDAVTLADQTDAIDFSDYDYVVVFHAGAGEDFSLDNSTAADLSSRFVSLELLRSRFGQSYPGVAVDGNTRFITGGVVVPETENQSFINPIFGTEDFREIGLSGILIANFGSQLGMPDLFNTANQTPAIGVFGLEDQGAVNGDGLIPAEPDPWTKIYMGWAKPVIVSDSFDVHLLPKKLAGENLILKIPINASEYFLVENRQRNVIDNALSPEVISRFDTTNNSDGSITIDTAYLAGVTRSNTTKVITQVDEYDNALPGNGLLIWHIDENVIEKNLGTNSINNDLNRRGIRVVEGSGSQDIGYGFSSLFGTSIGSGDKFDYFYKGNEGFAFYNNKVDSVFFTPTSVPNTLSNDRAHSGIYFTQISPIQSIMRFNLRTSLMQKGFPRYAGASIGFRSIKCGDVSGDSKNEIVSAGADGLVYVWNSAGEKVINNDLSSIYVGLGKDSTRYLAAVFASAGDSILHVPALTDLDNNGKSDVIAATKSGKIFAWEAVDGDLNGFADSLFVYESPEEVTTDPLISPQKKIVVGCKSGKVIVLNSTGSLAGTISLSGEVIHTALISTDSVMVMTTSSLYNINISTFLFSEISGNDFGPSASIVTGQIMQDGLRSALVLGGDELTSYGRSLEGFPVLLPETILSKPSLADLDGDGYLEIVFAGDNKIYAYNHNGTLVTNFPITIDPVRPVGEILSSVLVADIDSDNHMDIIAGAPNGSIYAYGTDGRLLQGFPLSAGKAILSTPMVVDLDNDGDIEIAVAGSDGFVYVWDLPSAYDPTKIKWGQYAHDGQNSSLNSETNTLQPVSGDLIPKNTAYNYPNPVRGNSTTIRYFLTEPAEVKINIFDLAGDMVESFNGSGVSQTDNEVIWNLKKIQSGVYLAKISAHSTISTKKSTRTVKIAVTK